MKQKLANDSTLIISYLTLRTAIGVVGIALPFVVSLGALVIFRTGIQGSISSYYHTGMRDVFVGALWAIGFFLFSYKGFDLADNIAAKLGCVFAVCVSLFPTAPAVVTSNVTIIIGYIHLTFAALFFMTLIYFSLVLFTKTDSKKRPTKRKLLRNKVYKGCGYTMSLCILLIIVYKVLPSGAASALAGLDPIYWLEAIAIIAFGISWLTKGEAILKDGA